MLLPISLYKRIGEGDIKFLLQTLRCVYGLKDHRYTINISS